MPPSGLQGAPNPGDASRLWDLPPPQERRLGRERASTCDSSVLGSWPGCPSIRARAGGGCRVSCPRSDPLGIHLHASYCVKLRGPDKATLGLLMGNKVSGCRELKGGIDSEWKFRRKMTLLPSSHFFSLLPFILLMQSDANVLTCSGVACVLRSKSLKFVNRSPLKRSEV